MYEPSLRTPLLVRWPGVATANAVQEAIVSNVDFAATFLDMAGVEASSTMQGRSLVPILQGNVPSDWRQSFYYHYYEGKGHNVAEHYGVTNGRLKLIHYYKLDEWELFDLKQDPLEVNNLYGQPDAAADQTTMLAELKRLRSELEVVSNDPPLKD